MSEGKKWTRESISHLLKTNDKAVARATLALYERQTSDEQMAQSTRHHNSVGFNSADASYLSYCARYAKSRGALTGKHLEKARRKLLKYTGQLADIANAKSAAQIPEEVREHLEWKAEFAAREQMMEARAYMDECVSERGRW